MSKIGALLGFLFLLGQWYGCRESLSPSEYAQWLRDPANGFWVHSRGDVPWECLLLTPEMMAFNDLQDPSTSSEDFELRREHFAHSLYFKFTIPNEGLPPIDDFGLESWFMEQLSLSLNHRSYSPDGCHFIVDGSMRPYRTAMVTFPVAFAHAHQFEIKLSDRVLFSYQISPSNLPQLRL